MHRTILVGALLAELFTLLELYVQTLLIPGPFNAKAITIIGFFSIASFAFAYYSSSLFRNPEGTKRLRIIQLIVKPPFVVWIVIVAIILLQLVNGLIMIHIANGK